jgi:hypothetical protein
VAKAPLEIRSLARKHTHKALKTLVSIMVEPKAPAAARIMAANALLDRGWGKAAQLVDVQGEIKQLVEVRLNVVQAAPASHVLPGDEPLTIENNDINDLADKTVCLPAASLAILSNRGGGFGSFLGPAAGEVLAGGPRYMLSQCVCHTVNGASIVNAVGIALNLLPILTERKVGPSRFPTNGRKSTPTMPR